MAQDEWRGVHLSLLVLVLLGTFSLDCVRSRRLPLATVGGRSMLHSPCGEGGLMIFMNTLSEKPLYFCSGFDAWGGPKAHRRAPHSHTQVLKCRRDLWIGSVITIGKQRSGL